MADSNEFLMELVRDVLHKVDALPDKVDARINSLEDKISADNRVLRTELASKVAKLETKVDNNTTKIAAHEHNFKVATFILTSGLAGAMGVISWLYGLFGNKMDLR